MSVRRHMKNMIERKIARFLLQLLGILILIGLVILLALHPEFV